MPLRILFTRSLALPALPAFAVVLFVFLNSRGQVWAIEWDWAVDYLGAASILLGSLAAGVAAADAAGLSRGGLRDVVAGAGGSARAIAASWAVVSGWSVGAYLVAYAVALAIVHGNDVGGHPTLAAAAPGLSSMLAFTAIGTFAGRRIQRLWVAPAVAAGVVALVIFVHNTALRGLVRFGGATGSLVGAEFIPGVLVAQTIWVLSSTLALLGLAVLMEQRRRVAVTLLIVAALAAGPVAAGAWVVSQGDSRFRPAHSPALRCSSAHGVEICLATDYANQLASIAAAAESLSAAMKQAGAIPPRLWTQGNSPDGRPAVDTVEFPGGVKITRDQLVQQLVNARMHCADESGFLENADLMRWYDSATWYLLHASGGEPSSLSTGTDARVRNGSAADRAAAFLEMWDNLARCGPPS